MTKADLVDMVAKGTGLTKLETSAVVDGVLASIIYNLEQGKTIELRGFGTFCLRERKEKHIPNPKTGKMMVIPHRMVPDFKPSAQFKESVAKSLQKNGKFVSETRGIAESSIFQKEL